jgi:hypothetical protein
MWFMLPVPELCDSCYLFLSHVCHASYLWASSTSPTLRSRKQYDVSHVACLWGKVSHETCFLALWVILPISEPYESCYLPPSHVCHVTCIWAMCHATCLLASSISPILRTIESNGTHATCHKAMWVMLHALEPCESCCLSQPMRHVSHATFSAPCESCYLPLSHMSHVTCLWATWFILPVSAPCESCYLSLGHLSHATCNEP